MRANLEYFNAGEYASVLLCSDHEQEVVGARKGPKVGLSRVGGVLPTL